MIFLRQIEKMGITNSLAKLLPAGQAALQVALQLLAWVNNMIFDAPQQASHQVKRQAMHQVTHPAARNAKHYIT